MVPQVWGRCGYTLLKLPGGRPCGYDALPTCHVFCMLDVLCIIHCAARALSELSIVFHK